MDSGNKLKKVAYNRSDKEGWIENRDFYNRKQCLLDSTFLNLEASEYCGRKLLNRTAKDENPIRPIPFTDIGIIDF